jgi:hypothetical protein
LPNTLSRKSNKSKDRNEMQIHLGQTGVKAVCTKQIKLRTGWIMGDMIGVK